MKKNTLLLILLLLASLSAFSQKHETGVHGGGFFGYPIGKFNDTDMAGGFRAGAYYRYAPIKWIGVQGGLQYQYFDENQECFVNRKSLHHALVIPVQAVVFPRFRCNLMGGFYMKNLFGKTVTSNEVHHMELSEYAKMYDFSKRPVFGYEVGVALNRKYCRFILSFRKDLTSWMDASRTAEVRKILGWAMFMDHPAKSTTFHLSVEVPLWRNKDKQ